MDWRFNGYWEHKGASYRNPTAEVGFIYEKKCFSSRNIDRNCMCVRACVCCQVAKR